MEGPLYLINKHMPFTVRILDDLVLSCRYTSQDSFDFVTETQSNKKEDLLSYIAGN